MHAHHQVLLRSIIQPDNTGLDMLVRPTSSELQQEINRYWKPRKDSLGNFYPYPSVSPGELPVDPRPIPVLISIAEDSSTGYITDCDLEYSTYLHDIHSDYPLAPEYLTVTRDMLSPFRENLIGQVWRPSKNLIPNLYKSHYVTHYRNLQFYVKQGLTVTKIHSVLSLTQSRWLKPWIQLCTTQRQNTKSEFESDLAKLQANATFGNRVNIRLIADPAKLRKAASKPSCRQAQIINPDLVTVRAAAQEVRLNKPIAVGFCILELSKLTMYKFYYDYLKPKLFTDTDSLCCEIQTPDLYHDMSEQMDLFDTSNFNTDHPLYSKKKSSCPQEDEV